MLNCAEPANCAAPPAVRRLSNISFPPHGTVEGSEENVEKEELFLCQRLTEQTVCSKDFRQTHWVSWNNRVASVIQGIKRPVYCRCGLVALCMAGRMLRYHDPSITLYKNDEAILKVARNLGYTKQGEMFSVKQYGQLARKVFDCDVQVLSDTLLNSMTKVLEHLALGCPIMVPYDTDRNYEPCLRKGHKAHWAIITGFVIGLHERLFKSLEDNCPVTQITDAGDLSKILEKLRAGEINPSFVYLYAKQGKSARQQLWSLKALSASNANLIEVCPERDRNLYIVPQEGIKATLCSQSVLVSPRKV